MAYSVIQHSSNSTSFVTPLPFAMVEQSTVAAAAALQASLLSTNVYLDYFESDDIEFSLDSEDLGRVGASESMLAHDLCIHPVRKRVQAGAEARFCISSRVRQEPDSCAVESFRGVARVISARIEKIFVDLPTPLDFSVSLAAGGEMPGSCIDLVVTVPEDAEGSEVVLRRASVAGCDVPLGEAPVRVIVGFNHEPAPKGRVYAAARAGHIPALTQALDDGCSTQETHKVSVYAVHALFMIPVFSSSLGPALL
jgi:hypothetical protein